MVTSLKAWHGLQHISARYHPLSTQSALGFKLHITLAVKSALRASLADMYWVDLISARGSADTEIHKADGFPLNTFSQSVEGDQTDASKEENLAAASELSFI